MAAMDRVSRLGSVSCVMVVGLAASSFVAGCGAGTQTRTIGQNSWAAGVVGPRPPERFAARARGVASHSQVVRHLLGPQAASQESFVWLGSSAHPRVVELVYRLPHQRVIDAVVPFADNPPDAPAKGDCQTPYAPGWERLQAHDVSVVFAGVDVMLRRVVDIATDAKREVLSSVAGRPFPNCEERQ